MPDHDTPKPSFSSGQRWLGALHTGLSVLVAFALVVMMNYLAGGHATRFHVSQDAPFKLSRQTKAVLDSLTNKVNITIFFQPNGGNAEIFELTRSLLNEYQYANPRHIHLTSMNYSRDTGPAQDLITKYNLDGKRDKDFILFESDGHAKFVFASQLSEYDFNEFLADRTKPIRRSAFKGEQLFTSDIYAVSNPQSLKAYFLYGHGENDPGNPSGESARPGMTGYTNLAAILKTQIDCDWDRLSLLGTNDVPHDCQLLIVAGPKRKLAKEEVDKIAAYLKNRGRLLALLPTPCGLESMLSNQWGITLGDSRVLDKDPQYSYGSGSFGTAHYYPSVVLNAMVKDQVPILMSATRPILPVGGGNKIPGAPEFIPLACTSSNYAVDEEGHTNSYFLLGAVEQGVIKGVETPRGAGTRIILAGNAVFLEDAIIESASSNHQFAYLALTWLLQRPPLMLEGLVPQTIKEYKLVLSKTQTFTISWIFLGGMPASILALGALVWLRRRH